MGCSSQSTDAARKRRRRMKKTRTKITGAELEIMEHLWGLGTPQNFAALLEFFNGERQKDWCKQTLNTNLLRLKQKGLLNAEKTEGRQIYTPAISKKEYDRRCAEEMLDDLYGGKLQNLITALSGGSKLSAEVKEELLEYIETL